MPEFPGFNYNKSFMESMMGVREAAIWSVVEPALRPVSAAPEARFSANRSIVAIRSR